jgi:hypothetical protein
MIHSQELDYRKAKGIPYDASIAGNRWVVNVAGWRTAVIEINSYAAWATCTFDIKRGNNPNGPFFARSTPVTIGVPGAGTSNISAVLTLDEEYLIVSTNTTESTTVNIKVFLKDRTQ